MPVPPKTPGGHTVCHLIARVDIIGGRTGLLSSIRSSSAITFELSLGNSYIKQNTQILLEDLYNIFK